jgi:hypothetical protein
MMPFAELLALLAAGLLGLAIGLGAGLFLALPVARRDARQEFAPIVPRAAGRLVNTVPLLPAIRRPAGRHRATGGRR